MFVCCCVEHGIRLVGLHNIAYPVGIAHRTDQYGQIQFAAIFTPQFLLDLIGIVFVHIKNDELLRFCRYDLSAKFTSDRTASACYQ